MVPVLESEPRGMPTTVSGRTIMMQDTVCQVCGDVGYRRLLLFCRCCNSSAAHQYCLDKVVFDSSLVDWFCYECLQRRAEVTCVTSLEKVSSERSPSHAQFGSKVNQPITKRVELARDAGPWRNGEDELYMTKAHGDSNSKVRDGLMLGTDKVKRLRPDYRTSNGLPQRSTAANVLKHSTWENAGMDKVMPSSPNDACEKAAPCPGIKNNPSVAERSEDSVDTPSISQHDTTEASESSETMAECQENVDMAAASSSSDESEEDVPSENVYLGSSDLQASLHDDYVIAHRTYLSKAQKKRIATLIRDIQPETTVFIAMMRRSNVQPPGPFLGIDKEYALAYFPDESTHVTIETPGKSKKWHVKFYRRDKSRKTMLMGQWLDFVRENHVQEGDICLLFPTECGRSSTFTVCVLHETTTNCRGGAGFQRAASCSGRSSAKMTSQVNTEEEPTTGEYVSIESDIHEIHHESLESEDSDDLCEPPYFVPCKSPLSKSQKKIVEQRVRAIRSEIPICVAVMKNNNVGMAQRWMLELASRYSSIYLARRGQNVELQCQGKTWEAKIMFHNGRRWFLNGGWPNFARGNGLRVGDICLFKLKKERKLIMAVHIIRKEQF